ncbi:uncharacterized protein LOC134693577 [Mytilus trossulus]|uniref:uncharacterized protein LOC134693577 n=1 Tax=Mytilus trossulus TaxID=6551 RepID=UPI003007B6D3
MWYVKGGDNKFDKVQTYVTDTIKPWRVKQSKLEKKDELQDQWSDEVTLISEIPFGLDALVCNCLIGVCMAEDRRRERNDMEHTNAYYTTLSMYLLTREKWRIPNRHRKPHIKKPLDQRSLEYIYEQVITSDVLQNLWYNQKSFVKMEYQPPAYLEDDEDSSGQSCCFNKDVLHTKGNLNV